MTHTLITSSRSLVVGSADSLPAAKREARRQRRAYGETILIAVGGQVVLEQGDYGYTHRRLVGGEVVAEATTKGFILRGATGSDVDDAKASRHFHGA